MRGRGVDGFPVHFGKRGVVLKSLYQVRIGDVRTTERHKICQSFCDEAIPAPAVHIHICYECAFEERTEMPEHAVPGQLLEWSSRKVGGIAHQQQVRKVVATQLLYRVFRDRQGFFVGLKCCPFVHRADLDSNLPSVDLCQNRMMSNQVRPYEPLTSQNAAVILVDQIGLMSGVRDYSIGMLKHNVVALAKAARARRAGRLDTRPLREVVEIFEANAKPSGAAAPVLGERLPWDRRCGER